MKVISGAGEFEIGMERLEIRGGRLLLVGKMGVWEAETFIEKGDVRRLLYLSLNAHVLGWALTLPFRALLSWLLPQKYNRSSGS